MDVAAPPLVQSWAKSQGGISQSCAGPVQHRYLNEALMNCWFYVLLPAEPGVDGGCGDGAAPALLGVCNEPSHLS